ncbi:MAG: malate dehydrogenase [Desulfitobacteriaceae bacterium]
MRRKKITIIGAGNTGTETALMLAMKGLGDIILLDTPQVINQTSGKALDLLQATAIFGSDINVKGTSLYKDTSNSDLIIITSGSARKPGMSRDDLMDVNLKIVSSVIEEVVEFSPDAIFLILTNPVDIMTYVAYKVSGLPKNRIVGQAGVLDAARFRSFIAQELDVSVNDVSALVLGVHGDDMVPLPRYTFVNKLPINQLLKKERIEEIINRTRNGGAEIVNLLGNGSAYYAPAASLVQMAECILLDQKRIITCVAYLEGEYGYYDLVLGVPVVLGLNGIERIIELNLLPEEKEALHQSSQGVRLSLEMVK